MHFQSIRWRIAVPYVILTLFSTLALSTYFTGQMRQIRLENLTSQLLAQASIIADASIPLLSTDHDLPAINNQALRWAHLIDARVTIIGLDGSVLGESDASYELMDNLGKRPEVVAALSRGTGDSIRLSRTVGIEMSYVALAIENESEQLGVARVAVPLSIIEANLSGFRPTIFASTLVIALLAIVLALLIAERTARPVRELTAAAGQLAGGNLDARLLPTTIDEVGRLTTAFNLMADQLRLDVVTLAEERSRLETVLTHMADGVLITDSTGNVQQINPAAADLLGTSEEAALGRTLAQVVRYYQIIELWQRCLQENSEQVEAMELGVEAHFFQVIVTPFEDADLHSYLVIIQDLTRIRRLETARRDFVANISHELRTPLAGLKALVDTLRDGALDDPPAAKRFLNRIDIEVDSLTQMVQELLELSRIESGQVPLKLVATSVRDIIVPPVERLRPQAARASLALEIDTNDDLPCVLADADRAQQVIANLVHNAIKFTPPGGRIKIRAYQPKHRAQNVQPLSQESDYLISSDNVGQQLHSTITTQVIIEVSDSGVGIPSDDLPRIFERFYKADRARSGGGTGLGLAIAKHIVQAHNGVIWVESAEGAGSTFLFSLPAC